MLKIGEWLDFSRIGIVDAGRSDAWEGELLAAFGSDGADVEWERGDSSASRFLVGFASDDAGLDFDSATFLPIAEWK